MRLIQLRNFLGLLSKSLAMALMVKQAQALECMGGQIEVKNRISPPSGLGVTKANDIGIVSYKKGTALN